MKSPRPLLTFAILGAMAAGPAAALQIPSIPGLGGMGGLPSVGGMGMGNVAGVLGYCMKNNMLGGSSGASSVLGSLQKKPGVTGSKGFAAGEAGKILSGGNSFSLDSVSGPAKSQMCNMVLKQAKTFL